MKTRPALFLIFIFITEFFSECKKENPTHPSPVAGTYNTTFTSFYLPPMTGDTTVDKNVIIPITDDNNDGVIDVHTVPLLTVTMAPSSSDANYFTNVDDFSVCCGLTFSLRYFPANDSIEYLMLDSSGGRLLFEYRRGKKI